MPVPAESLRPASNQSPLPFERLPMAHHVYAPGELFPGRAGAGAQEPTQTEPMTPVVVDSTSTPESKATEEPVETIVTNVDRMTYSGIRYAVAERKAARTEQRLRAARAKASEDSSNKQKVSRKDEELELAKKWGEAAEKGQPFGKVKASGKRLRLGEEIWPKTQREEAIAQRAYKAKDHKKVAEAALRRAEGGTYEIDPTTGKSKHRKKHPKLRQFPRSTRKSIRHDEKLYAKQRKKVEHANHILHPHHTPHKEKHTSDTAKLEEKAENRRQKADRLKTKAQIATVSRDVKQIKRSAFVGEVVKAWRGRTQEALLHREEFYEDLGRVADPYVQGEAERMRVGTYDVGNKDNPDLGPFSGFTEGGLIERAARRSVRRHKDALNFAGEKNLGQAAQKRKQMLEKRAAKYHDHKSTTNRRRANVQKLNKTRRETHQRYEELRIAKQRLADLRRPAQP